MLIWGWITETKVHSLRSIRGLYAEDKDYKDYKFSRFSFNHCNIESIYLKKPLKNEWKSNILQKFDLPLWLKAACSGSKQISRSSVQNSYSSPASALSVLNWRTGSAITALRVSRIRVCAKKEFITRIYFQYKKSMKPYRKDLTLVISRIGFTTSCPSDVSSEKVKKKWKPFVG